MSQWKQDINGEYKRVHKRQWRRRACIVYFYKVIWNHKCGFLGADVYTAKPKGKFPCGFSFQAAGGVKLKLRKLNGLGSKQK